MRGAFGNWPVEYPKPLNSRKSRLIQLRDRAPVPKLPVAELCCRSDIERCKKRFLCHPAQKNPGAVDPDAMWRRM